MSPLLWPSWLVYKVRWLLWALGPSLPIKEMYLGPGKLDRESRLLIIDRAFREHAEREPKWRGRS